jgi:hypothetical protein
MEQPIWNFEQEPWDGPHDETSVNLRAHFDRIPDEKIQQYRLEWTDERVMAWDGDFTDEGTLLLACSERDVEIDEYREVLAQALAYRERVRPVLASRG